MRHGWIVITLAAAGAIPVGPACAQTFQRPLRFVTTEPGGSGDFLARLLAKGMSGSVGQQVIVENRAGFMSIETVMRSQPDGHSMLIYSSTLWIVPLIRNDLAWNALRDFTPIALAMSTPTVLAVHPAVPATTVKDLISLAKSKPGALNYSASAAGSANHLAAELFKSMAGVNIVNVPYKGAGPALNALMAGEVQVMFPAAGSVAPHLQSGRIRGLAVASMKPSALLPGMPTISDTGLPGYELVTVTGVFGSAGMNPKLVERLNREIVTVVNEQETKERLLKSALEAVGGSAAQLAAAMKSETVKFAKVIRDAGIRAD
jgi:tripartite-type tricarboxylate transporter receptor subunit TctC